MVMKISIKYEKLFVFDEICNWILDWILYLNWFVGVFLNFSCLKYSLLFSLFWN